MLDEPTDERPAATRSPPAFAGTLSATVGFALADLPTEQPAPHRAATPRPTAREVELDAPAPSLPPQTPAPVSREPTARPGPAPIRVAVETVLVESQPTPVSAPRAEPTLDLVPDGQREAWVLDRLHELASEIRDYASWVRPVHDTISALRLLLERADKRDEARVREERDRREAELAALADRPRWRALLEHPHAGRAFGLATWLAGTVAGGVVVGLLDYLGAETEPVIKLFVTILGFP